MGTLALGSWLSTSVPLATAKDVQPKGRMVGEQGHPCLFLSPKLPLKLFRAHKNYSGPIFVKNYTQTAVGNLEKVLSVDQKW